MIAGKLTKTITLQRLTQSRHTISGESQETVVENIKVFAEWLPERGNESFLNGRDISHGRGQFKIRFRDSIDSLTWQIKDWQNRIWDIIGEPIELGRREALLIPVELRI